METIETPRVTRHAAERCAEMGISTKVAKQIVRHHDVIYPSPARYGPTARVVRSDMHPAYAVAWDEEANAIITVIFNTPEFYVRQGTTFLVQPPGLTD